MNDFQKLTTELNQVREIAGKSVEQFSVQTRTAWGSKINQAKAKIKKLEHEYAKALHKNSQGVFLTGSRKVQEQVANLVKESGEGLVLWSDALYREIFGPVLEKAISKKRSWMIDHTAKLQELLRNWMNENKITSAAKPGGVAPRAVNDFEQVVEMIQALIENGNNETFNLLYLEKQMCEQALKLKFEGKTLPVIFLNGPDQQSANALATKLTQKGYAIVDVDQFEGKEGRDLLLAVFKAAQRNTRKRGE